jgi:PAS domain S-box-containing protein
MAALPQKGSELVSSQDPGDEGSLFFAANPIPMWVYDPETLRFLDVNEAAVATYGFSRDEFLGMTIAQIRAPEDIPALLEAMKAPETSGLRGPSLVRHRRKDGTTFTVQVTSQDVAFEQRRGRLVVAQDLSALGAHAVEVHEKHQFLQSILDSMPAIVFVRDLQSRFTLVNEAWERFTGVSRSLAAGKTAHFLFPPDVADRIRRDDVEMFAANTRTETEETVPGVPGLQTLLTSRFPLRDETGRVNGLIGLAVDISERKRAEDQRREYERVVEGLDEMIIVVGRDYRYLLANRAYLSYRGETRDEILGRLVPDVLGKDVFEREVQPRLDECLAGKVVRYEMRMAYPGIGERDLSISYFPIEGPAGIDRVACVLQDVTEHRRAQEQQARLSRVVEQATDSILITDPQGTMIYVNPAFERISGYSRAEAIGQNPRMLKSGHQDAAFYRRMWETLARGEVWKGRMVNRRKDGTLYQEDATIGPVRDASGRLVNYVAVKQDVTNEMRLERQLMQAQKMEAVGRLAGGVAHDFNNLLGVITGYGEMTLRKLRVEDPLRGKVDQILKAADRAAGLTRQLLAFSRQQVLQPKIVDLNDLVSNVEKMLRRLIGEDIELATSLDPALGSVRADPGQVEQVLMNLAVNARDAMPDGGRLTIETQNVELGPEDAAHRPPAGAGLYVMLVVTDSGTGMDAETLSHLFEPFFTTKDLGKGTGLGLSTVYGIVKQSGGYIWCESEVGRGTTFRIHLPRVDEDVPSKRTPVTPGLAHGTETILLIEDDPSLRDLVGEILEGAGYTVLVADSGPKALQIAEEFAGAIHLIVTDVIMPGLTGRHTAETIKAARSEVKILFMSGYTSEAIAKHGVLSPGARFLGKPFSTEDLLRKIRDVLDDR